MFKTWARPYIFEIKSLRMDAKMMLGAEPQTPGHSYPEQVVLHHN